MNILDHDIQFWTTVGVATLIKLLTSPLGSLLRAIITALAAVFSAVVFTDPVISWLGLDAGVYRISIAALLTLTGEGIMRQLIAITSDPKRVIEIIKAVRGGGK